MIGLVAAAAIALTGASSQLHAIIAPLSAGGADGQAIVSALASSPELVRQFDEAAISGTLRGLVLAPAPAGHWGASHKDGVISITSAFVEAQTPTSGDLTQASRNLVFILGYEAAKVRSAPEIAAADAQGLARFKAAAPPRQRAARLMPRPSFRRVCAFTSRMKLKPIFRDGTMRSTPR